MSRCCRVEGRSTLPRDDGQGLVDGPSIERKAVDPHSPAVDWPGRSLSRSTSLHCSRMLRDKAALEGDGVREGFDDLVAGRIVSLADDLL